MKRLKSSLAVAVLAATGFVTAEFATAQSNCDPNQGRPKHEFGIDHDAIRKKFARKCPRHFRKITHPRSDDYICKMVVSMKCPRGYRLRRVIKKVGRDRYEVALACLSRS